MNNNHEGESSTECFELPGDNGSSLQATPAPAYSSCRATVIDDTMLDIPKLASLTHKSSIGADAMNKSTVPPSPSLTMKAFRVALGTHDGAYPLLVRGT
ncbi:hypothetical protein CRV24_001428 [Beauveria bassiana]|nr:hypothetical protein CRV24_001428 [Beauveria bassiana]